MAMIRWMTCGCLALAACGGGAEAPKPGAGESPIVSVDAPPSARKFSRADTAWSVTPRGIGSVTVGANARDALGLNVTLADAPGADQACAYVRSGRLPAGVGVLAIKGEVARIDVDSGRVATLEGVRIGDPEARVREVYANRVKQEPHKYETPGHYLIVTPADQGYRIIFETDGKAVTSYRAGRMPEVEWVEKCG
jgi:hypothetical protein